MNLVSKTVASLGPIYLIYNGKENMLSGSAHRVAKMDGNESKNLRFTVLRLNNLTICLLPINVVKKFELLVLSKLYEKQLILLCFLRPVICLWTSLSKDAKTELGSPVSTTNLLTWTSISISSLVVIGTKSSSSSSSSSSLQDRPIAARRSALAISRKTPTSASTSTNYSNSSAVVLDGIGTSWKADGTGTSTSFLRLLVLWTKPLCLKHLLMVVSLTFPMPQFHNAWPQEL